ncbi:trypsin-like serine protease [Spirosoma validum]|uniref:Trypsin-like serine protease n=1 Tax=Spirosoma validum TaxID=2771355 RepID=A0A927B6T8_9BACT|nr:trypsin-like serine protease [Spirosoma validum]MBD2756771.1 trypsin-like serine protease [Spirosoma validum]
MKSITRLVNNLLLVSILLVSAFPVAQAQVITQRFAPGTKSLPTEPIPTLTLPPVDLTTYLLEDAQRTKDQSPFRFGANIAVDIDLLTVASRTDTPTERIYRYQLYSAGAYSLNLILDQLTLVSGAQLYLYDPAVTMQIGPITDQQNIRTGEFWSDLLQGDRLILELREPINSPIASQVHIRNVVHGYKNVFPSQEKINESGSCEVNMACFPARQFEGDGVIIILTSGGSAYCTGSILNDSRQSFRSFLLSANHCGVADNSLIRFKYQSPNCTPTSAPAQTVTMNGSDFRANYAGSDVSLRELKQQIPATASVTYLGWNRTNANASNAFGIHHPEGDVKKISFTNANTEFATYGGANTLLAYWNNQGVTEPGSSGSPLFDGNGRVIGQLYGGPSTCAATGTSRSDYYGRFFTSWTGGGTASSRLSNWLDPTNLGNLTTSGVKSALSGPTTVTNAGSFSMNTGTASVTSWSIAGAASAVTPTSGTGNVANLAVLSSVNSLTIVFSVNAGQSYPIQFSQVFDAVKTSDIIPIVYARPSPVYGSSTVSLVVDVVELNSVATNGLITVKVTKDTKATLTFDGSLTTLGGRSVQNSSWTFSSDANYYTLTTTQPVTGGDKLSLGLDGILNAASTTGVVNCSATVIGGGDGKLNNNVDADKIEYFQQ